jgi:hypothetical protein
MDYDLMQGKVKKVRGLLLGMVGCPLQRRGTSELFQEHANILQLKRTKHTGRWYMNSSHGAEQHSKT